MLINVDHMIDVCAGSLTGPAATGRVSESAHVSEQQYQEPLPLPSKRLGIARVGSLLLVKQTGNHHWADCAHDLTSSRVLHIGYIVTSFLLLLR